MASEDVIQASFAIATISRWTAFWMLAGLAANVMAQPCGRVCGIHSKHRTYLRSSPFICAIDGLCILLQLSYYTYRGDTLRNAAHRILQGRFVEGGEDGGDDKGSIEWSKSIRIILFAVGMLPAVIKLYTLGGIPWTKTWGSMYLASFLLIELLLVLVGKQELEPALRDYQPDISKKVVGSEYFGRLSLFIHFVSMEIIHFYGGDCVTRSSTFYICFRQEILFSLLIPTCTAFTVAELAGSFNILYFYISMTGSLAGALITLVIFWNFILTLWPTDTLGPSPQGFDYMTLAVIAVSIALFYPIISKSFYQILFLINLSFALFYYIMIFDSRGTTDPSWLELFG